MTSSPPRRITPEQVVGFRLRQARERMGATQAQIGEWLLPLLGKAWPRQAIYAAEHGDRAITVSELMALASVLDVAPATLLTPPAGTEFVYMPGFMIPMSVHDLFHYADDACGPVDALRQVALSAQTIAAEAARISRTIDESRV